jgi:pimeloyl-ACP methyl ester carboxylesterase
MNPVEAGADAAPLVRGGCPPVPDAGARAYVEHRVPIESYTMYARDWPGPGPALVLMHGFPDNLHLYDRLLPELGCRRVIAFDFLGWGESDKPTGRKCSAATQAADLDAIIGYFGLDRAVLVTHDSSGPPGIRWASTHPDKTEALVLMNTYYTLTPTLRAPEAITIFMTPDLAPAEAALFADPAARHALYFWQVGQFFTDPAVRDAMLPGLYDAFLKSTEAFRSLNDSLIADIGEQTATAGTLASFTRPVKLVFGADDIYLNPGVARDMAKLFPSSTVTLVPHARHYVQVDQPAAVARAIVDP